MARPSKYDPSLNKKVFKLALLGAKDTQIADFLEIAESTLNNWKTEYPELMESLKAGKAEADAKVASCLYKRAIGFRYDETTHEAIKFGEDQSAAKLVKTVRKLVIPDTTAQIFWLKNRQPKDWRDKQEVEQSGGLTIRFEEPRDYVYPAQDQGDNGIPESL